MSRPILHHLNADSSWLLQIPNPRSTTYSSPSTSAITNTTTTSSSSSALPTPAAPTFCNILLDPWLSGPQSDLSRFFSTQSHAKPSAYASISDIETRIGQSDGDNDEAPFKPTVINLVIVSHEFTDHCHQATLLELPKNTPICAPKTAADLIKSWNYFNHVYEIASSPVVFGHDQTIPSSIQISRLQIPNDALYFHSAVLVSWPDNSISSSYTPSSSLVSSTREYLTYTPHGVDPIAVESLSENANMKALCLLHGMHNVRLYGMEQLNLGGHNGLALYRKLKPKYWLGTHDEVKQSGGLVKYVLARTVVTIRDAFSREQNAESYEETNPIPFEALENGGKMTLI